MLLSFVAFVVSLLLSLLIVRSKARHGSAITDTQSGPQKLHHRATPRIGGVAVFGGLCAAGVVAAIASHRHVRDIHLLLLAAIPVFTTGLAEDLTKRVVPMARFVAAIGSALLAAWLLRALVPRTGFAWADEFLQWAPLAWAFSAFAVAGICNAVNIIDGLNGLAGMVAAMMFASLAYVALLVGDTMVLAVALMMIGAIGGFFLWNFPDGHVFLGDGGAYLLGFVLATLAILVVARNPDVSAWYPVLLFIYPIFETLFSAYRRARGRRQSVAQPDAAHLHSLVYKRLMRLFLGSSTQTEVTRRNAMTAPYLWVLCAMAVGPATLLFRQTWPLLLLTALFCVSYVWVYVRIVRFKTPGWLLAPRR